MLNSHTTSAATPITTAPRRRHGRFLAARVGAVVAAMALMAVVAGEASATVSSNGTKLECRTGQVIAYAPFSHGVFSSYTSNRIFIGSRLDKWNGSSWVSHDWSGWWAYGNTYTSAGSSGWAMLSYLSPMKLAWVSTGVLSGFPAAGQFLNYQFPSVKFNVTSGQYYRVVTLLYDEADGDLKTQINLTGTWGVDGTPYCLA